MLSNLFKFNQEAALTVDQQNAINTNSEIIALLGNPVPHEPRFVEVYQNYTPALALKLVKEFRASNQRNSREGSILHLAVQSLKGLLIPELRAVQFQNNLNIDGLHFLNSVILGGKEEVCLTRYWSSTISVMDKIDQGVARTIRDYYKIVNGSCDGLAVGAMGVIQFLFTGKDVKHDPEFLKPYFDYFGEHYEAVKSCLVGKFRNPIWAAILTITHAINGERAIKMGHLVANNTDCERGTLLYCLSASLRDKKGKLPTGTAARKAVIEQLFTGAIYYIGRGNVKIKKLQPSRASIAEALRALDVEVITLDTLRAEFEELKMVTEILDAQ